MTKEQLKAYRQGLGMTLEQFAHHVGLASKNAIRMYESGDRPIPGMLVKLIECRQEKAR